MARADDPAPDILHWKISLILNRRKMPLAGWTGIRHRSLVKISDPFVKTKEDLKRTGQNGTERDKLAGGKGKRRSFLG